MKKLLLATLLFIPGCVNHPSYWSEESCEYCLKQNEHYSRVLKDEMFKTRLNKLEYQVKKLKAKEG